MRGRVEKAKADAEDLMRVLVVLLVGGLLGGSWWCRSISLSFW